jgi:hypothetical protein
LANKIKEKGSKDKKIKKNIYQVEYEVIKHKKRKQQQQPIAYETFEFFSQ